MRPINAQDFDIVYDIYMDETVNPFMYHEYTSKEAFKPVFEDLCNRSYAWIFQNSEGADCAIATATRHPGRCDHVADIQSVAIKQEFQGQGIGKMMVQQMIEQLKQDGCKKLQLFAEADNPRAIAFYKSFGFKEEGLMPGYVRRSHDKYVDEVVMGLIIT